MTIKVSSNIDGAKKINKTFIIKGFETKKQKETKELLQKLKSELEEKTGSYKHYSKSLTSKEMTNNEQFNSGTLGIDIAIPDGVKITYSHKKFDNDGIKDYVFKIEKNGISISANVKIKVEGIDAAKKLAWIEEEAKNVEKSLKLVLYGKTKWNVGDKVVSKNISITQPRNTSRNIRFQFQSATPVNKKGESDVTIWVKSYTVGVTPKRVKVTVRGFPI